MRIGVISDSHGKRTSLTKAINKLGKIDLLFHLGDLYTDALYIENTFKVNTYYVRGNCDFSQEADLFKVVELEGKRFFLTHGHVYRVKWGLQYLQQATVRGKYDMVFFGHTHIPEVFFDEGVIYMNPGSSADPRMGKKPTVGLIELTQGRMVPYIININD